MKSSLFRTSCLVVGIGAFAFACKHAEKTADRDSLRQPESVLGFAPGQAALEKEEFAQVVRDARHFDEWKKSQPAKGRAPASVETADAELNDPEKPFAWAKALGNAIATKEVDPAVAQSVLARYETMFASIQSIADSAKYGDQRKAQLILQKMPKFYDGVAVQSKIPRAIARRMLTQIQTTENDARIAFMTAAKDPKQARASIERVSSRAALTSSLWIPAFKAVVQVSSWF